jgi:hypothetical protein
MNFLDSPRGNSKVKIQDKILVEFLGLDYGEEFLKN